MGVKVLELNGLRNNTDEQCVPICLFVVLNNQFQSEKRTNISGITYKNLKKWVGWGQKARRHLVQTLSDKDRRYLNEIFKGTWNIDFHQGVNPNIRHVNLTLEMQIGFSSNDIKQRIDEGKYPMVIINPQYINESEQNKLPKKLVRGIPKDQVHFIVIHGYKDDEFYIYDCDLRYAKGEKLDNNNIRCKTPFAILKKYSQEVNRIFTFELIDKTKETKISQF